MILLSRYINAHLNYFPGRSIRNSAEMSIFTYVFWWAYVCISVPHIVRSRIVKVLDKCMFHLIHIARQTSQVVVQSLCHVWLFATPWAAAHQTSLSFTVSRNLLKLISIELVMSSNHLILCWPFLFPPSVFPSIRVFSSESAPCLSQVLELQLQDQSFQWMFRVDFL